MNFDELNEGNYILFAIKNYNNPHCHTREDFDEDMKRFKYLKRLFKRYIKGEQIRYHLALNHLIILYNVFGEAAGPMLFYNMDQQYWGILKTFLLYLNKYPIGFLPDLDVDLEIEKKSIGDMTMMTAGTGGFSGAAAETGPNAGFDPLLGKFRSKVDKKRKKKIQKESRENPNFPSRLFQYKVRIPEVGETIIYASSLGELQQKMRLLINPKYRADIDIERILPAKAAEFFQDKRMKHMRNIKENQEQKNAQAMADQKIATEKKKISIKKQELQKQLQLKTQQLKKAAAQGSAPDETR